MGSPFAPNEVPAPVLQRRWRKSRYHVRTAHEIFKVLFSAEKKNTAHAVQAKDFVGVKQRQNESGVLRGGKSFHRKQNLTMSHFIANSVGFAIKGITDCRARQDVFANFIAVKR